MTERIDSAHNPRIRAAARLRLRRDRKKSNLILIDGVREAQRALDAGIEFIEVFLGADRAITPALEALHLALIDRGTTIHETAPAAYAKVRYGDRDDGVVVVARRPQRRLDALKLPPAPLIAVVDQVEKPGNLGAILRTADAAGVHAVIAADARGDVYGPNTIRASLGAIFTVPVAEATGTDALAFLKQRGIQIITATPDGASRYSEATFTGATAIVLGAEAAGVRSLWRGGDCQQVVIPMRGRVDSLNVSATAAVLFFEALRQRERASARG